MTELIRIPTDILNAMSRTMLIRQWWYTYRQALNKPADFTYWHHELNRLTAECERVGIVKPGVPMPREGAEDLARDVDQLKKHQR